MEDLFNRIWEILTVYGLKIIAALAILVVGIWISRLLKKVTHKMATKKKLDSMLVSFIVNLTYYALLTFVILAALAQLGIQTTSFIAIIGAAGLAIGLALQGSLANFAAGFLIIIFRPFKAGDFIEGAGVMGTVEAIHVFTTQLKTPDNKMVIVPNAKLTADNITNFSANETRRVDLVFGISYEDNIDKTKELISEQLARDTRVLKDPAPTIGVVELADSSVNLVVRPWVRTADYWNVYFDTIENIKKRFDSEGISIPFPQRDIHLYEHKT